MPALVSFYLSIWSPLALALFVAAVALSYRIEKRSTDLVNRTGVPRSAMLFHTIFNRNVARDPETQRLRRIMLALLLGVALLFVLVALAIGVIDRRG
ncbi:MAG: hypothetical protein JNK46_05830 [Methylobacteriaceae bacterium]|nr:hypothetical protein [Methylobacteriaceae bacterium]